MVKAITEIERETKEIMKKCKTKEEIKDVVNECEKELYIRNHLTEINKLKKQIDKLKKEIAFPKEINYRRYKNGNNKERICS